MSVEDIKSYGESAPQDLRECLSSDDRTAKKSPKDRFFWPPNLNIGLRNGVPHGTNNHPFIIKVGEAHVPNAASTKVNTTILEDAVRVEGAPDTKRTLQGQKPEKEKKKERERLAYKPFSLFHFCRKKDKSALVLDHKGTAPPSTPESVEVTEDTDGVLFRPVSKVNIKRNEELPSLNILSNAPTLPPIHSYDEPPQQESKDLSSLYDLISVDEKTVNDFTSVDFELESYSSEDGVPNPQQGAEILPVYGSRSEAKDGWSSAASLHAAGLHLARSITAGIRPALPLPLPERAFSASEDLVDVTSESLEDWMTSLHPDIRKVPLNHLFIPGSHDAFSFSLSPEEDIGPDAPGVVARLDSFCSCMARPAILRWSITQKASVADQLKHGIRYFDIRVAVRDSKFFFVHGLFGDDLAPLLSEISNFLSGHPGEVVLLDFQHFHGLNTEDHGALIALLHSTFSDMLCPFFPQIKHLTLSYLALYKYQVLVFYRHEQSLQEVSWLWSSTFIPNPWPNTTSTTKMITFLENHLKKRDPHTFFVTQCILTPSGKYLLRHFSGMLENKMAAPCNKVVCTWVGHLPRGAQGPNIVMTDFVEYDDWAVPRAVVKRNSSPLLPDTPLQRY